MTGGGAIAINTGLEYSVRKATEAPLVLKNATAGVGLILLSITITGHVVSGPETEFRFPKLADRYGCETTVQSP